MTDWPATRAQQIAALEAALQVPGLPEGTKQQILEQLRALWHGHSIVVLRLSHAPASGVDTPEDLAHVRSLIAAGPV